MDAPTMPTDRRVLKEIYNRYYNEFISWSRGDEGRRSKIYVPIDIDGIAKSLSIDGELIFGLLYYHLEKKYGYKQDNGAVVHLFTLGIPGKPGQPDDRHCVNFPLLASVMADLERDFWWNLVPNGLAVLSLLTSGLALYLSYRAAFPLR